MGQGREHLADIANLGESLMQHEQLSRFVLQRKDIQKKGKGTRLLTQIVKTPELATKETIETRS